MPAEALKTEPETQPTEPVFVFGTDLAGAHKNESAAFAVERHGAAPAKGSGASGDAYAIPYRNSKNQLLEPQVIGNYVESFFGYARTQPELSFRVARFGCESGAHSDDTMARLFAAHPSNCQLPGVWQRLLAPDMPARVLLFDPGAHMKEAVWQQHLQKFLDLNVPLWGVPDVELVSVGIARAIVANDMAARKLKLKHRIIGTNEAYYGRHAPVVAEARALWYCTHVISIMDFEQTAQPQQIRVMSAATRSGLQIEQVDASQYQAS